MNHDRDDDDDHFPTSESKGLALDERTPRPEGPRRHRSSYTRLSRERPPRITDYEPDDLVKATEAARIIGITRDAFVHRARTGQIPNEGRDELGHRMFSARKMWGLRRRFRASESAPPSSLAASAPGAYPSSAIAAFIADGEVAAQVFKLLKQGASRADVTIELSLHPDVVAHHADKYQEAVRPRAEEAAIQEINQLLSERGLEPMAAVGTQELHRAFLRVAASADAFRQERDAAQRELTDLRTELQELDALGAELEDEA